nr:MAG TPA: hypothetical protein [Bacteriophage sp.]
MELTELNRLYGQLIGQNYISIRVFLICLILKRKRGC